MNFGKATCGLAPLNMSALGWAGPALHVPASNGMARRSKAWLVWRPLDTLGFSALGKAWLGRAGRDGQVGVLRELVSLGVSRPVRLGVSSLGVACHGLTRPVGNVMSWTGAAWLAGFVTEWCGHARTGGDRLGAAGNALSGTARRSLVRRYVAWLGMAGLVRSGQARSRGFRRGWNGEAKLVGSWRSAVGRLLMWLAGTRLATHDKATPGLSRRSEVTLQKPR